MIVSAIFRCCWIACTLPGALRGRGITHGRYGWTWEHHRQVQGQVGKLNEVSNLLSGLESPFNLEHLCIFSRTIQLRGQVVCHQQFHQALFKLFLMALMVLGLQDHLPLPLWVVLTFWCSSGQVNLPSLLCKSFWWSFCSSQRLCLCWSWRGWRHHGPDNTGYTNHSL